MPGEPFPKGYYILAHTIPRDDTPGVEIVIPEGTMKKSGDFINKLCVEARNCLAKAFSDQPDVQIADMAGM